MSACTYVGPGWSGHADCLACNPTEDTVDKFTTAYIEALFFTDTGDTEQPSADADLSDEAMQKCIDDCKTFQEKHADLLAEAYEKTGNDEARSGHDFWLTRNGHGAGFWDGDWPGVYGDKLTEASKVYGEVWTTAGDDGEIDLT